MNNILINSNKISHLTKLEQLRRTAQEKAYHLLDTAKNYNNWEDGFPEIQFVTAESLTGGMIHSILVDIPSSGALKYGTFGVYDTLAKRISLGVTVDDLYTHVCAQEMAVGALNNSTATVAISVTGNALPYPDNIAHLGEVFIGVAFYYKDINITEDYNNPRIAYSTKVINACDIDKIASQCRKWYSQVQTRGRAMVTNEKYEHLPWSKLPLASFVSQAIRLRTTALALEFCNETLNYFINNSKNAEDEFYNKKIYRPTIIKDIIRKSQQNIIPTSILTPKIFKNRTVRVAQKNIECIHPILSNEKDNKLVGRCNEDNPKIYKTPNLDDTFNSIFGRQFLGNQKSKQRNNIKTKVIYDSEHPNLHLSPSKKDHEKIPYYISPSLNEFAIPIVNKRARSYSAKNKTRRTPTLRRRGRSVSARNLTRRSPSIRNQLLRSASVK